MKKIALLITLMLLCTAMVVTADTTKSIGGYFNIKAILDNNVNQASFGPDWGGAGSGIYDSLGLTLDAGTMGITGGINFHGDAIADTIAVGTVNAWVKPVGDALRLTLGKIDCGDYKITTPVNGSDMMPKILGGEWGIMAQIAAIANASIGVAVSIPVADADVSTVYQDIRICGSYNIDKVAKIYGGYLNAAKKAFVIADITAIAPLDIKAGYTGVLDPMDSTIWACASMGMGDISLGLDGKVEVATATSYSVAVNASYNVPSTSYNLGAKAQFDGTTTGSMTPSGSVWAKMNLPQGEINLAVNVSMPAAGTTWEIPLTYEVWF